MGADQNKNLVHFNLMSFSYLRSSA